MNQYQSKVNEELGGFCCCGVWVHLPLTLQVNNSQEGVRMSHLTDFCGGFITDYYPQLCQSLNLSSFLVQEGV